MASTQLSRRSLAALTDTELEILRLLAAGHTAKSIAAELGRSESSINERLRDARRKTGIGSSRELARLLDAQKIWNKKIDLAAQGSGPDTFGQALTKGPKWSKGKIIMLVSLPLVAAGLVVMAAISTDQAGSSQSTQAEAMGTSPLVGRWSLDVSRIPPEERPQSVTIEFDTSPDGKWTTHVEIVDPDGTRRYAESTARPDGVSVPLTGNMAFIDTGSLRHPEANTLVVTLGKAGKPVSTRVYTVADDRQSMTETIIWAGDGIPKLPTTHFKRIG
ncbi:helix-turn-helix domain-containing protein [Qipengyuania qiaonensis]|uniref:Helix-turn-helix transcriptional regulator n=1 Tax=Qipengyuania qiaonensis TaxID=2867240 RepID=A0ABS7J2G6_9SPHN|nr:helix-turn-helix transcriptional regulator [Qipengyuania qiaonensis]MBX7481522.1 helix-turn-helix transcriptional regulator [Qipengyuania qiaonensis]